MPVKVIKYQSCGSHILLWEITESEDELLSLLPANILINKDFESSKVGLKRLEMLASRAAISTLAKYLNIAFDEIEKDEFGKPYLGNCSWQISLTHSKRYIGVIFNPNKPVGIDIEMPQIKMWKIKERLFTQPECDLIGDSLTTMCLFWSAKEALYKLYGKRGVDFRKHLHIIENSNGFKGIINMDMHSSEHAIFYENLDEYLLVWAI